MKASVKIMLSYDYNHFEICLGTNEDESLTLKEINELRKNAQRLADHAVEQYKTAKRKAQARLSLSYEKDKLLEEIDNIQEKPESERTAQERAKIKALDDKEYWNQHQYDYDDDDDMWAD